MIWVSRKLRPRNFRPQTSDLENADLETSDLETSDLENSDFETSDPLKNDWNCKLRSYMNVYFFTKIIVTNPKCQITKQSRIDNCRQVKGFQYFYSKQKQERQEQWQNYFTFLRVTSGKKRPELPGQYNDLCHTYLIYTSRENNACSVSLSMNPRNDLII